MYSALNRRITGFIRASSLLSHTVSQQEASLNMSVLDVAKWNFFLAAEVLPPSL